MKKENEITEEVRDLLNSLEQHGRNARRQKELGDLIDQLERRTENELLAQKFKIQNSEFRIQRTKLVLLGIPSAASLPRNDDVSLGCQ